jgi:hypothetical protein
LCLRRHNRGAQNRAIESIDHRLLAPTKWRALFGRVRMMVEKKTYTYHEKKLKTLLHYTAYRCAQSGLDGIDGVKLNKVAWFSDLERYVTKGAPLTGGKYLKKPKGPVASQFMPLIDELQAEGAMAIRELEGRTTEYLALTTPDVSVFSADELRVIEDAFDMVVHKHTSKSISEKSHDVVWKLADLDGEIPYYAIHAGRLRPAEKADLEWARGELAALGIEA